MKNLITFLLVLLSSVSFSQSLENTEWEIYIDGDFEANVRFGVDTFYADISPETAISIYTANSDTFRINDLESLEIGCFYDYGDIWGTYLFQIQNDTLTFTLIDDECLSRIEILDYGIFIRTGQTFVKDLDTFNDVFLYPNPLENGILNIKSIEPLDLISVYDIYGRLILSTSNTTSLDLSGFPHRIFIVVLNKGKKTTTRKIVKQ